MSLLDLIDFLDKLSLPTFQRAKGPPSATFIARLRRTYPRSYVKDLYRFDPNAMHEAVHRSLTADDGGFGPGYILYQTGEKLLETFDTQ